MKRLHWAVLWVAAACRGDQDTGPTGSDTGSDPTTTGPRLESVRVLDRYVEPVDGIAVAVNDADGALLAETITDADGRAVVDIPEGGSVTTFIASAGGGRHAHVVRDVPDGAEVIVNRVIDDRLTATRFVQEPTSYRFELEGFPIGASQVRIAGLCGDVVLPASNPSLLLAFTDDPCAAFGTLPEWNALILAEDSSGALIGWGAEEGIQSAPGDLTLVGPVDVGATAADRFTFAPVGFGAGSSTVLVTPVGAEVWPTRSASVEAGGAVKVDYPSDPAAFGLTGYHVFGQVQAIGTDRIEAWTTWSVVPGPSAVGELDEVLPLDQGDLPTPTVPNVPDVTDPTHPTVAYSLSGPRGDAVALTFSWARSGEDNATLVTVYADPSATSSFTATVPTFPASASDFVPTAADLIGLNLTMTDLQTTAGYGEYLVARGVDWTSSRIPGEVASVHRVELFRQ